MATLPTTSALDCKLSPIQASLRDLSQRVSGAPPLLRRPPLRLQFLRPVSPHGQHPSQQNPGQRPVRPPPLRLPPPPSTPTSPSMTRVRAPFTVTLAFTWTSSRILGKQTRSMMESTPTPPPSSQATSPLTAPSPNPRIPRLPPKGPRRARRIRAPSRPPKSRQPVTSALQPRHQGHSLRPRGDSTLFVPPAPNTHQRP